jgi:predicted ATP-dependent endonuclease of OLD family
VLHLKLEPKVLRIFYRKLSSGHKMVLKMVVELTAHISGREPTLVLVDEPETHLHPPLLAALLQSIRACLDRFDGYAVIATHSPVVLQETPSRSVRVLRRAGDTNSIQPPILETFGENIGVITQDVFNLGDGTGDWHDILARLADEYKLRQIEEMFGKPLGFAARSYILSLQDEK